MPAHPQKRSRDSVVSAFHGLWKISTHIWHQASPLTLFQHQRMWPVSGVCWDQVASTVSTKYPSSRGTAFPRVAQEPPGAYSAPGDSPFPPEHCQVCSCGVAAFALPLFTVLMEFKPSPFSLFSLVPAVVSNFPLSLQLSFWGGVLFSYSLPRLPPVFVLSPPAKAVPYLQRLLAPQIPLPAPHTC